MIPTSQHGDKVMTESMAPPNTLSGIARPNPRDLGGLITLDE
jgi:hypothetical protein